MPNAYFGKILWINLSTNTIKEKNIPDEMYAQYLGGYGLASKLIYQNLPPKTDPLSPEAIIGFFPGLLTGSIAPLTGRFMVTGKSPLTGTWGDSNCGGYFGAEIKKCGYDGILIKGKATAPKYISIIDGKAKIQDADALWGLDTNETDDKLNERHRKVKSAIIGQSGENLSLMSCIIHEKYRAAGRSGFGAVMGSKNLKALVLKGNVKINIADNEKLIEITKEFNKSATSAQSGAMYLYNTQGLACLNTSAGISGDSPIKNWKGIPDDFPMESLSKISGDEINKYKVKNYGCFSCSIQCGALMKVPEANLEETHIPEYETCAAFGSLILNEDVITLFTLNDLCNRAGLDTISVGGTVAYAMECYEKGILTKEDLDGIELEWGNSDAVIEIVERIIDREGIGDLLADGPKFSADRIGKGTQEFAIHSMGQALPMHDVKFFNTLGRTYAFDPTPGRHTAASLDHFASGLMRRNKYVKEFKLPRGFKRAGDERFESMKLCDSFHHSINSLGLCYFTYWFQTYPLLELIEAVVGWKVSVDDLLKIGARIQALRQAFTIREGVILAKNELPGRVIGDPPFEQGPNKGKTVDYKGDYKGYCEKMGWNPENGYPLKETLNRLDLDFVVDDLY
ncbi:MAG: aldehyde ferredoxin oxidoreductase [Candidatus Lokiarchaeota archaeon]|nr:aldehyde ferredoxin oxidoreductase [Candidatus Lokiarchaeota archaeon]MBD3199724.1 aldehyde ferredoxin oxidoreductase [Candidatus Lokiarchaeota archaeon]